MEQLHRLFLHGPKGMELLLLMAKLRVLGLDLSLMCIILDAKLRVLGLDLPVLDAKLRVLGLDLPVLGAKLRVLSMQLLLFLREDAVDYRQACFAIHALILKQ